MADAGAEARAEAAAFLDTGYLIALEDADDTNHEPAREHWKGLRQRLSSGTLMLTTTSYVLDKVVTFFNVRGHHRKAVELGEKLMGSASLELVHVEEDLLQRGFAYLKQRQDKRYSLTDCVSFVVMADCGITTAFAFDRHFAQAGFRKEP